MIARAVDTVLSPAYTALVESGPELRASELDDSCSGFGSRNPGSGRDAGPLTTLLVNEERAPMAKLVVNQKQYTVDVSPDTPLLWALRDTLGLTGTKYACGIALCGACTVHVEGEPTRSCVTPVSAVEGKTITTIEGLSPDASHPVQQAWIAEEVAQCGYCQPGQIMSAAALLSKTKTPTDGDIDAAMSGNICRCGTYPRIRRAIHTAARLAAPK
jgi:aerobic-type carbon monoxide dehydrogenase small subunit (CoxS/CutS family)